MIEKNSRNLRLKAKNLQKKLLDKNPQKRTLCYCEKNCYSDREKVLKFEAEGQEFAIFLKSLEQFIQGQNNFW